LSHFFKIKELLLELWSSFCWSKHRSDFIRSWTWDSSQFY